MAITYRSPVDLAKNELQNATVHPLSSAPGTPVEGQAYTNTTGHTLEFYNGSQFVSLGTLDQIEAAAAHVSLNNFKITNLATPTAAGDATSQGYVLGLKVHDFTAPTAALSMNSQKITNLTDGTSAADAVNRGQLDGVSATVSAIASGISWKDSVRAVATTNGTLASAYENGDTVGAVVVATGDRILLVGQTAGEENGIRVVAASGAPARADDSNTAADVRGTFVPVEEGTGAGKIYYLATDTITLDTTALVFSEFTGATYIGGAGLTLTGTTFAVGAGTGITVNADDVAINTAVVARKHEQNIGDGSTTSIVVTHNLGTRGVQVSVWDNTTPFQEFQVEVRKTSTNTVTLVFAVAPTTDQYSCSVIG